MSNKSHLDEFCAGVAEALPKRLVDAFSAAARDASLTQVDVVTRLKTVMEEALTKDPDAPARTDDQ